MWFTGHNTEVVSAEYNIHRRAGIPNCDAPGCVSKVPLRCLKRWQCLHCRGPFGATVTRKLQSSMSDFTFDTSSPHDTYNEMGWEGGSWRVLVATAYRSCVTAWK